MPSIILDVKERKIQTLIDEVKTGKFYLPSFQRRYVWDEDDIKDLIDSVINNYPIGTIILWRPSNPDIIKSDPFAKPIVGASKVEDVGEVYYVIDGQQRLTSLLLVFNDWSIKRGEDEEIRRMPISYNPSNGKFYKGTSRGIDLSKLIKAFCFDDMNALQELMKILPPNVLTNISSLIRKILDYPIPICIMQTLEENEQTFRNMAEAFIRINKYGVRIGNIELMLSFLAGAMGGEIKEEVNRIYEDLYGDFKIDLQPVVRFIFSILGLRQSEISNVNSFTKNVEKVVSRTDSKEVLSRGHKALRVALEFIRTHLGSAAPDLIPSYTALIPLCSFFYERNITNIESLDQETVNNLLNWFILVSFNGYYSSQTDTKLDADLELIRKSKEFPYNDLLNNMADRKIRVKIGQNDIERSLHMNILRSQGKHFLFLLYVLLVKEGADDWTGTLLSQRLLAPLAKHHIYPKEYIRDNLRVDDPESLELYINSLANITFIHKDVNAEIGDTPPQEYLHRYRNALEKHFIPTDSHIWTLDQYNTFRSFRITQIHQAGRKHFREIFT